MDGKITDNRQPKGRLEELVQGGVAGVLGQILESETPARKKTLAIYALGDNRGLFSEDKIVEAIEMMGKQVLEVFYPTLQDKASLNGRLSLGLLEEDKEKISWLVTTAVERVGSGSGWPSTEFLEKQWEEMLEGKVAEEGEEDGWQGETGGRKYFKRFVRE